MRIGEFTIDKRKAVSQGDLIAALNPIIKGWSNYFSSVCSKRIFSRLDELLILLTNLTNTSRAIAGK
ncbi:MAG: group II intron maturase-specific domain-containing protein [Xenococcus sp. (in: cyanobacteria)]